MDPHGAAVLIGYGANAIHPKLLAETVIEHTKRSNAVTISCYEALKFVHSALNAGILKIMSKMGISTIASYRNAGLFDIIGLNHEIVEECFATSNSALS